MFIRLGGDEIGFAIAGEFAGHQVKGVGLEGLESSGEGADPLAGMPDLRRNRWSRDLDRGFSLQTARLDGGFNVGASPATTGRHLHQNFRDLPDQRLLTWWPAISPAIANPISSPSQSDEHPASREPNALSLTAYLEKPFSCPRDSCPHLKRPHFHSIL